MAFELDEHNLSALEPLFRPWEEPTQHRMPNPSSGQAALIRAGRRPSKCPLVRSIRAQVDQWRKGGYPGVSETSRTLLNFWFQSEHSITDGEGNTIPFRYHWAQREAIETMVYLYEMRGVNNVAELMLEFGGDTIADLALGINPDDDRWARNCCKIATGGGKTKVMSLAIVWSYFHRLNEKGSNLAQHFVVIAPNLTVYERLKDDFENCAIFYSDPLLPPEWKPDFQMQVVLQEEPGGSSTTGAVYLTNIHRLYEKRNGNDDENGPIAIFGPDVKRAQALDTGAALRERIASHPRLMVLNDEAHHLHDPELAWNRAIDTLHSQSKSKGNEGLCLQLDFTATPKHNNGDLFRHIVCDFPLGEAVDGGIVKVPVLGESADLQVKGDKNTPAHEKYRNHLEIGYQRYAKTFEEFEKTRKPILFVMTEDAKSADEIAQFLDDDDFPLLKGKVLNIHTKLKGRIKTVKRGGREVKEFVENETSMKPEDLRELREMSRELDKPDSKFRCVVSVMMLREGWDVKNVTTIIPLRAYSAKSGILPEQTLGRGLRLMFPGQGTPEMVTVVHHPAFRKLYEDELAQEGLDIAVLPIREAYKQTVSIFVDHEKKPVEDLEIEIPLIADAIESSATLEGLSFEKVRAYFEGRFKELPLGEKDTKPVEYKERHLFTDEIVSQMEFHVGLLSNAWSAPQYFAQMLGRVCKISNAHQMLTPLIEKFISEVLFNERVDLFSGQADHRMRDADVLEHIRATFTPLVLDKVVTRRDRKRVSQGQRLSAWKPFQATSNEKRPAVPGQRTMFNLVPCENDFEQSFADFCDYADDVAAYAKNAGPQKLMIDYMRPDGHRALYVPDFFIRDTNGGYWLVELKGKTDSLVPLKAKAATEWCKVSSRGKLQWQYLYVPFGLFQESASSSVADLVRACDPSLISILGEAETGQQELPLFEGTGQEENERLLEELCPGATGEAVPDGIRSVMLQAVSVLDHSIRANRASFGHAFQPLLKPLDDLSLKILDNQLRPHIPQNQSDSKDFFYPLLGNLDRRRESLLSKNQRYLFHNLVFGRSIQKLGTLLFCLDYARQGGWGVGGVWETVAKAFKGDSFAALYAELSVVNQVRNTKVAHVETEMDDEADARKTMGQWLNCLCMMLAEIGSEKSKGDTP